MAKISISGAFDNRAAIAVANKIKGKRGQHIIVSPDFFGAEKMAANLSFFVGKKVNLVPDDRSTVVRYEAKNRDAMLDKLAALLPLVKGEDCIVCMSFQEAITLLPPRKLVLDNSFEINKGDEISILNISEKLVNLGYRRCGMVYSKGQFALRGDIIDVFTPYYDNPFRIELFDTEVESIRSFDKDSQRSIENVDCIEIFPAATLIRTKESWDKARSELGKMFADDECRKDELFEYLDGMSNIQQLSAYIECFYEKPEYIWDYASNADFFIEEPGRMYEECEPNTKELETLFNCAKNMYYLTPFESRIKGAVGEIEEEALDAKQTIAYDGKLKILEKDLEKYLNDGYEVQVVCISAESRKNMIEHFKGLSFGHRILVRIGDLSSGVMLPNEKRVYITERDIFGVQKRRRRKSFTSENTQIIKSFSDIKKGDYVVHESYGIGRFEGIQQLDVAGETHDYLTISYAGEDKLYVQVEHMDRIQKYVGADSTAPKINHMSGVQWQNTKARTKAAIANMVAELVEMSARRELAKGYAFGKDTVWQSEFEDAFPYEMTSDQVRCIEEIKKDMESERIMDRLLCGDVGYGKTEVAARAMFKAACDGKQVALLVPMTVLASQHFNNLKERFGRFPIKIEMLSRFRSKAEQTRIVKELRAGSIDIVIGTHRLLSDDIEFKNLGLLVVDEEQRFGVAHKERIKQLRQNVDVLTLTATPIPRTLHMSLVGIKSTSLIEEPPEGRYPVQTYVVEEDKEVIKKAIEREIERGGQVYFIYNRISGTSRVARELQEMIPGLRVTVCHGSMSETAIEDAMMEFINHETDVMVATTIIENGIDIPNVNTLIVLNADKFGLSQLYQLRGRVGRSTKLAYAYLMHQPGKVLKESAAKRLQAIRDFTEFGAGYKIAMRDLEIRGAGNILGSEQHGHMIDVGYELYCKMVDDAVRTLRGEVMDDYQEANIDVKLSACVPDYYIEDENLKLYIYKRIATIMEADEAEEMVSELIDRFGAVPKETMNLIKIARLKNLAERIKLDRVSIEGKKLVMSYPKGSGVKPQTIFLSNSATALDEAIDIMSIFVKGKAKQ